MDFDFSTLIYIIGAIIYFVLSGGKKKNKKAPSRPVPPIIDSEIEVQEEKSTTFEDLLREFTGETVLPRPEPIVEKVMVEPSKPQKEITTVYDDISRSTLKKSNERFEEFQIEEEPSEDWLSSLRDSDEARRAFIYSEIFKRKY